MQPSFNIPSNNQGPPYATLGQALALSALFNQLPGIAVTIVKLTKDLWFGIQGIQLPASSDFYGLQGSASVPDPENPAGAPKLIPILECVGELWYRILNPNSVDRLAQSMLGQPPASSYPDATVSVQPQENIAQAAWVQQPPQGWGPKPPQTVQMATAKPLTQAWPIQEAQPVPQP